MSMKPQIFRYVFPEARDGDHFVNLRHIRHAISNSDQYPVEPGCRDGTPEGAVQEGVLNAVVNAIDAVPVYTYRGGRIEKEDE